MKGPSATAFQIRVCRDPGRGCRRRRAEEASWPGGMERRASEPAAAEGGAGVQADARPLLPRAPRSSAAMSNARQRPAPGIPRMPGHPGRLGQSQPRRRRVFRWRARPDQARCCLECRWPRNGSGRRLLTRARAPSRDGQRRCLAGCREADSPRRVCTRKPRLEAALNPAASCSGQAVQQERPEIKKLPVCEEKSRHAFGARRLGFTGSGPRARGSLASGAAALGPCYAMAVGAALLDERRSEAAHDRQAVAGAAWHDPCSRGL